METSYLKFDKLQLVNLEYSLSREVLQTNRVGVYSATTLAGCNTRKYHGLFVVPLNDPDQGVHVLLSSLDVTVIQHESEFNLGIHKYPGDKFEPKGHKYIRDFSLDLIPKTTYRVGGVVLTLEKVLVENEPQALLKFTLQEAHSPTTLRFKPFLAFRNVHRLSKANMDVNTHYEEIENGIRTKLYEGYPYLNLQFSKIVEFIPVPDWYYGIEYPEEISRGYEYAEDLFVPGYFEMPIQKGESIIFSVSTELQKPSGLLKTFSSELKNSISRDGLEECLMDACKQFIRVEGTETNIIAGYPWYGSMPRHTFVALPGIALAEGNNQIYEAVLDSQLKYLKDGLFPKEIRKGPMSYDAIDIPLLFFWCLQKLCEHNRSRDKVWKKYGPAMKSVLVGYRNGLPYNICIGDDGLVSGGDESVALTWMDGYIEGKPVTPRTGKNVEINALWYNAICFALDLADESGDNEFVAEWSKWPDRVRDSFLATFWNEKKGYLADTVNGERKDWTIRPNMLFATIFDYSPLTTEQMKAVLHVIQNELLTPYGLRTLTPRDSRYRGVYEGGAKKRETAVHNGTVWPWLGAAFAQGYLRIYGIGGISIVREMIENFEDEMAEHSLGTIPEIYDGNPPHKPGGAISMAVNVSSLLLTIKRYEEMNMIYINHN